MTEQNTPRIQSENITVTPAPRTNITTEGNKAVIDVNYDNKEKGVEGDKKFWHLYSGIEHVTVQGENTSMHQLAIIDTYEETPPEVDLPSHLSYVGVFDHEPTEEEKDIYIPDAYKQ